MGAFRGSTHRVTRVTFRVHTARRCPGGLSVGGGAFTGSTHGVTRVTFRVHTARRCPGVRSVGGTAFTGLHTSSHTRHIPRPHGAKMPCRPLCWGWACSEAPHIASHRSDFASTSPEDALECVLLGVWRSQGSTHGVTRATFCVHTARRCPGVRSVGGGAFTGLNTSPHTRHILRPHGAKMPWSAFCWGWARSEAPHIVSHASHSASTRREDAL